MIRPRRAALGALLALLLAAAGCTSTRGGGSNPSPATGNESNLSGPPVVLGFVTMENAPVGSFPETRVGAQAAVASLNASGGVGGHRVELAACATDGTPESSQNCATQLIAKKPVAVVGGVDLGEASAMPQYARAGLAYVTGSPQLSGELNSPNSFALTGGTLAELLGITQYLTATKHVKSVHALYVDLPGLLSAALAGSKNILRKKGVTDVQLVAEKADAADFAPAVNRVAAGHPDAVVVVFPAQSCVRIMQAASALSTSTPFYYPSACAVTSAARAGGSSVPNAYFASSYLPLGTDATDPATKDYLARTPAASRSPLSQASYSAMVTLGSVLRKLGSPTPAAALAAMKATRNQAAPMAHAFTCDGNQVALFHSVCNTAVRLLRFGGGSFTDAADEWVDGRELAKLIK